MNNCSIQNQDTKEPNLFYRSDSGDIYTSVYDVLNNSSKSYETGIMNQAEDFVRLMETPMYDRSTEKGKIQHYIKNGFLTGSQIRPNTYIATDSYAAENLNADLLINEYNTFKRNGLEFEFGDFTPVLPKNSNFGDIWEAGKTYVEQKFKSKKPRPITYTKDQLQNMIENFMKKVGFSITSIENYRQNYKTMFGIEPDAEALIDFNAQILAFRDGKVTLDQLSEEFSHFVIEAWNQEDIQRMLGYVNNTQEYLENAERYREAYSKQIKDPDLLEEAVRREVLGKMLANSLQKDFNLESRTETERNIFERLIDILKGFLNFVVGNINQDLESELNLMSNEIKNMLYNDNLESKLKTSNISPVVSVMYSLDQNATKEMVKKLRDFENIEYNSQLEREVDQIFNTAYSTALASNSELNNSQGMHDPNLDATITNLLDTEDLLAQIMDSFKKENYRFQDPVIQNAALRFKEHIVKKAERTLSEMASLKGKYKNAQEKDAEETVEILLEKHTGLDKNKIEEIRETVGRIQKDTTAFTRVFGHTAKTSNIFVNLLSKIIDNMQGSKIMNFIEDSDNFLTPLIPYRAKLINFIKNGSYRSGVNTEKLYKDERTYELSVLKQVLPDTYSEMDLETYIEKFQEKSRLPLDTSEQIYYKFRYLYDQGIDNQKWLNKKSKEYKTKFNQMLGMLSLGEKPWTNEFYQYLINKSRNRNSSSIQTDRDMSNPFYEDGSLKQGFTSMFYGYAKQQFQDGKINSENIVSTNARSTLFEGENEPNDSDLVFLYESADSKDQTDQAVFTDGSNAFYSMKWNAIRSGSIDPEVRNNIAQNFIEEYKSQKNILERKGLEGIELNQALKEWLNNSLLFEPTEAYWNNFETSDIRFNDFFNTVKGGQDRIRMEEIQKQYRELQLRKKLILRKYKNQNDYKEVDAKAMSSLDKGYIVSIENDLTELRKEIAQKFELNNLGDIYSDTNNQQSSLKLNTAFHEIFKETIGKSFDDDSLITLDKNGKLSAKEVELFFSNPDNFDTNKFIAYGKLKSELNRDQDSKTVQRYRDIASENNLGIGKEGILKAFILYNAPSWYKRYDANNSYDTFIRDYNSGKVDIDSMLQSYTTDPQIDQILWKNSETGREEYLDMRITPSFTYSVPSEPNIVELLIQYKDLNNNSTENLKTKFQILQQMGGIENIDAEYNEDMSDILNNPEDLKVYMMMMDAQMQRLSRDRMLKKQHIFLMPQVRKSSYERFESFAKEKGKWNQIKDYLKEVFTFREDDYENSYQSLKIPHYGYYRLKPEELSQDVFHAVSWGLSNANHYEQRLLHFRDAADAIKGLEAQEFERGKRATDTNYHAMMKEMMDFNFYGKTTSAKIEFDINGEPYDLSKFLFGVKSLGIKFALAFSPIVAATNFSSGVIQNAMMAGTGRNIYSPSNKRAVGVLGKLLPESMQDIGRFDPETKINKILYNFGIYDLSERHLNSGYSRTARLFPQSAFGMMAMTNFPLEAQSALTKLMEYRLIDGKFKSWRQFSLEQKTKNPAMTDAEIKTIFEDSKTRSMYDYIGDDGKFNLEKLEQDGYKENIQKDQKIAMASIRNIAEQTTMEISKYHEGSGGRDPRWSFVLSLKKWLVMATSFMTSRERYDLETGGKEQGLMYTPRHIYNILESAIKDQKSIAESYDELTEVQKKNIRTSGVILGILTTMLGLTILLKKAADDDEEENYLLQLSAYMALRNLNEAFSGNVGIGQSYFEAIQNPIMIGSTIKNLTNVVKFGDIGETVESGKYENMDKYWTGILKATWMKNMYTVSSGKVIGETRQSYEHFNTKDSFYHIFDLIPGKPKEEDQ